MEKRLPLPGVSLYAFFNENRLLAPFDRVSMGATNAISCYRITYPTVIPETGASLEVTGLLAVPRMAGQLVLPMVSWQRGTIFEPADAPSQLFGQDGSTNRDALGVPRSAETLFNLVSLAGNGYVVAAADYIGTGDCSGRQTYAVKDATVRTIHDMLIASRAVLGQLGLQSGGLYLYGWSQGALNTQWLADALQQDADFRPTRMAAVSAPTNLLQLCRYWMNDYAGDPAWLTGAMALLFGSYETYDGASHGLADLIAKAIRPQYQMITRKIADKTYDWSTVDWRAAALVCDPNGDEQLKICLPVRPVEMLSPDFLKEFNAGRGAFHARVRANTALQGRCAMPCRFYGGASDAGVPPWCSMLQPVEHQQLRGSGLALPVAAELGVVQSPERTGLGGAHRGAFLASLFEPGIHVRHWFDAAAA